MSHWINFRSLRRTTAEIQNYSFESKLVERDRDTTSQDSGISQMSAGPGDKMEALEERMETFSLQGNNSVSAFVFLFFLSCSRKQYLFIYFVPRVILRRYPRQPKE